MRRRKAPAQALASVADESAGTTPTVALADEAQRQNNRSRAPGLPQVNDRGAAQNGYVRASAMDRSHTK
jgi:hypothetical protein